MTRDETRRDPLREALTTIAKWQTHGPLKGRDADGMVSVARAALASSTQDALDGAMVSVVEQAARMGSCSQTHHDWIADAARKALAARGQQ